MLIGSKKPKSLSPVKSKSLAYIKLFCLVVGKYIMHVHHETLPDRTGSLILSDAITDPGQKHN
jgi:hypothetical protein